MQEKLTRGQSKSRAKSEKRASTPKSRKKTRDDKTRGRSASRRKADTRKASTSRSSKSTTKTSRTSSTYSNDRVDQTTPGVPYTMMKYKPGDGKEAYSFNLANSTYPKQYGWKKFWSDLCSMVSTKCAHPAYGLQWMFEIEHAESIQELRDNRKLDGLSSKLLREINLADAKLKKPEGGELNGRQIRVDDAGAIQARRR